MSKIKKFTAVEIADNEFKTLIHTILVANMRLFSPETGNGYHTFKGVIQSDGSFSPSLDEDVRFQSTVNLPDRNVDINYWLALKIEASGVKRICVVIGMIGSEDNPEKQLTLPLGINIPSEINNSHDDTLITIRDTIVAFIKYVCDQTVREGRPRNPYLVAFFSGAQSAAGGSAAGGSASVLRMDTNDRPTLRW